jgi:hypothetical protein
MLNIIIQIILAIFLILIMGFIAYSIYDRDYINNLYIFNTNKRETKIFTGIYSYSTNKNISLETNDKNHSSYINLDPSINQNGGAEYSYNFWLYFNKSQNTNSTIAADADGNKYILLFYKGSKQLVPYKQNNFSCDTKNTDDTPKPYILVKNPLIKLSNDATHLIVEYNNINSPDTFNSSSVNIDCSYNRLAKSKDNKLGIKDIHDMYNKTYNMITVVMQENPTNEPELFTKRTNCKVYFNGTLISDRLMNNTDFLNNTEQSLSTVMKKNINNLHLNPVNVIRDNNDFINIIDDITESDNITKDAPLKMADLSYFNYALTTNEISALYNKKFNTDITSLISSSIVKKDNTIGGRINYDMYNIEDANNNNMPVKSI